jgi:hypothetical protein
VNLKALFPRASRAFFEANETLNHSQLPHPKPQQDQTPALDSSTTRETRCLQRTRIRFTGHRVKPLDPDNFAASCKDLLDGLRHARLIPGDEPWTITFETAQEQVQHYSQECTIIELDDGLERYEQTGEEV